MMVLAMMMAVFVLVMMMSVVTTFQTNWFHLH